ncbi:MAG: hypothetical protein M0R21_09540 [Lentimicrobiaceae bacterium]|nr:hypothetical protein [Lentimicrobiaceae bacterium]
MKILFCLLGLLISTFTFSQKLSDEKINVTDTKGRKQGYWKKIDETGNLKYQGQFKNNIPIGEFRYYYPKDILKTFLVYSDNGKVSRTTTYHRNGKVMAVGKYVKEKKDSIWTFFDETGCMISKELYRLGLKEGVHLNYYQDGKVSEKTTWKNDIKQGEWVQYFPDGNIKVSANYSNNFLNGKAVFYFPDGKTMVSGEYHKGNRENEWLYYSDTGLIEKKEIYKNGFLIKEIKMEKDSNAIID